MVNYRVQSISRVSRDIFAYRMPVKEPCINVKNLSVTYFAGKSNEVHALKDVSLDIYPGEFVIFFGPSGCGKSTLLYSIAGLERHTTGDITVLGKKVPELTSRELELYHQRTIGMIFQAFYLIPSLSVSKNVQVPQIAVGGSIKDREARAAELLKHFGVDAQAHKLPTELSGGQQQRVAICRSLINDPEILLADEPVGNLDSKSASDVINLLEDLNERQKKTVILVTHNPEYLVIADRIIFMRDGQVIKIEVQKHAERHKLLGEGTKFASDKTKEGVQEQKAKEQLQKEFPHIDQEPGQALTLYTAREVLFEVLAGFSEEEMDHVALLFADAMRKGPAAKRHFIERLTLDVTRGGFGWDKSRAIKLSQTLWSILDEVGVTRAVYGKKKTATVRDATRIRAFIARFYRFALSVKQQRLFDAVVKDRMLGAIDRTEVTAVLERSISRGGVGMSKEQAVRSAKLVEIILLGRYTLSRKEVKTATVEQVLPPKTKNLDVPRPQSLLTRAVDRFVGWFIPSLRPEIHKTRISLRTKNKLKKHKRR